MTLSKRKRKKRRDQINTLTGRGGGGHAVYSNNHILNKGKNSREKSFLWGRIYLKWGLEYFRCGKLKNLLLTLCEI